MADFLPGADLPSVPDPVFEIPTPDIPAADFAAIGAQKRKGEADSGFWQWLLRLILDWIPDAIGVFVGAVLGLIEIIAAYMIRVFFRIFRNAEFGSDEVAAQLIGGLFGVDVAKSAFTNMGDRNARGPVARNLAEAVMKGLAPGFGSGGSNGIEPSSEGAERYLELVLHMEIDGWMAGLAMEFASIGQIESVDHLREAMEEGLGIGRLSRQVLGVPVKALVVTPFQQLIEQTYRPTLLGAEQLIRQYLRGLMTRPQLDAQMAVKGYTPDRIEALINFSRTHLAAGDLRTLYENGNVTEAYVMEQLAAQGYDNTTATQYLLVQTAREKNTFTFDLAKEAIQRFQHGHLTVDKLQQFITDPGLTATQRSYLRIRFEFEADATRTLIPLAEGVRLVKTGIWTITQFRELAIAHKYTIADVDDLELLLLHDVLNAADAQKMRDERAKAKAELEKARLERDKQKAAAALAEAAVHGVSLARYETLVLDKIKTIADYSAFATGKGISAANVAALTAHLQNRVDKANANAASGGGSKGQAAAKGLAIGQLEHAVKTHIMTIAEFAGRLNQAGLLPEDVAILTEVLQHDIDMAAARAEAIAAAHELAKHRGLNLQQEQLAVRQGFRSVDAYRLYLVKAGFEDPDVATLVSQMEAQIAADAAAREAKKKLPQQPLPKGLTLAQIEKSVRAGVTGISAYTDALARENYTPDAQAQLADLLRLQMEQDARTAAVRGQANGLLSAAGLSLRDIERAVRVKVLPMGAYTDALLRAGVSPEDAQLLGLVLAASIKATVIKPVVKKTIASLLAAAGLSLSHLEAEVLAGKLTLPAFGAILAGVGVDQADIDKLMAVLQLELDQRTAAGLLAQKLEVKAAARNLNLSQEIEAMKYSIQGLPDYAALAQKLGYDPVDVQILVATQAAKQAIAAA